MNRILFSFLISLIVLKAAAQKNDCGCFVKGVVRDRHTGQPVVGATILIAGQNTGVFTDEKGRYEMRNLCPGSYTLECRIVGYHSFQQKLDLTAGHEENFNLQEQEVHLKDVEITAHRTETPSSQPLTTLTGIDLEKTRGQNLGESLKGLAGVTTLQTGSSISKPVIHGLHSNRILIMNNGVRQEGQQWGSEHAPEIDPFIATRISVVKGAAGVRYGSDAIGGVILVEPEELPFDKPISGETNAVGFSNGSQGVLSGTVQGGISGFEGFGWRAQGTIKRGGNIRTPNYFLDNTGISEKNFSLAAGYRHKGFGIDVFYSRFATKIGIFSGSHIGSITDLLNVIKNGEPLIKSGFSYEIARPNQNVTHDLLKAETHYHFQNGNRLQWTIARQINDRNEYDLHRPRNDSLAALNHPELTFKLTTLTNDVVWDHKPIAGKIAGQIGVSTFYQYNLMDGRPLIPNFNQFNIGVFWMERYVKNGWELEAGVRYDYRTLKTYRIVNREKVADSFNFSNFSGTLGATRNFSERFSAKLNVGTAWRAPNVSELFSDGVHHGAAAYEKGDATLQAEKAVNSIASLKYADARWSVELGGYYNYISDFIYLKPQSEPILTIRGAFPYFKYTQTDATFKGIDLSATWELAKHTTIASKLSYLRVYDQQNESSLVMIPPNRLDNQLKYELPEIGKWNHAFVSIGNLFVARQTRVPLASDFLEPPKSYSLWNLQAGATLKISEKQQFEIGIGVQNLFNIAYRDYLNRFRYYADEMGRNASLRLKWKFGA
ncbi:TonB-dependent receptor [Dyadobacter arcticus]|uniref:Iron complex outermembrane receptor protein n=1 Tax=Dyadobacter arcticus TaxID=1078754 RepID=A0ABX0UJF8_9BACT|nr:TonB-dependent receptor [Dyadobacter arcticus]NIJ51530.1 iron complex outermembrane receptor protein [Dyadobacter arcticus]